jgi:hypothetical protein
MRQAVDGLETLPFSSRLLCDAHAVLMEGVRGESKTPGEFRLSLFAPASPQNIPDCLYRRPMTTLRIAKELLLR